MAAFIAGNFLGWITVVFFSATILNYILKFIGRKFGRRINALPAGKRVMSVLMTVFVKNHRYFGIGALTALLIHFIIQYTNIGFSVTGVIATALFIAQAGLGIYAVKHKKPRKGAWFFTHRLIAALMVIGVVLHLLIPAILYTTTPTPGQTGTQTYAQMSDTDGTLASYETNSGGQHILTLNELAQYDGKNGQPAYIAYKGVVYDVSDVPQWKNGTHNGVNAGTDVTDQISRSPHGDRVFADLPQVGVIAQ